MMRDLFALAVALLAIGVAIYYQRKYASLEAEHKSLLKVASDRITEADERALAEARRADETKKTLARRD